MGESSGKNTGAGNPAPSHGGGLFTVIYVAVVVALVSCIVALYNQNMELSRQIGEMQAGARASATLTKDSASVEGEEETAASSLHSLLGSADLDKISDLIRQEMSRAVDAVKASNEGISGTIAAAHRRVEEMMKKGEDFVKKLKKNPMLSSFF